MRTVTALAFIVGGMGVFGSVPIAVLVGLSALGFGAKGHPLVDRGDFDDPFMLILMVPPLVAVIAFSVGAWLHFKTGPSALR